MINLAVQGGMALLGAYQQRKQRKKEEDQAAQAALFEQDRDARIKGAQDRVDSIFDSPQRQQQRQQFALALRQYLGQQLGRKQQDVARNTKFGLARQGLMGSSVQRDAGRRLQREYGEAAIGNERDVQRELADLTNQDEQSRLALRQLATQGLSIGEANRRSLEATRGNLAAKGADANVGALGDYFAGATEAYKKAQERGEMRRGYGYKGTRSDLWGG